MVKSEKGAFREAAMEVATGQGRMHFMAIPLKWPGVRPKPDMNRQA
jgi:hypothetical protein